MALKESSERMERGTGSKVIGMVHCGNGDGFSIKGRF